MPIPTLPTPPARSRPATFADEGDTFLAALPAWGVAVEARGAQVEAEADQVALDAAQVAADKIAVAADRVAADASAASAVNSPGTNGASTTSTAVGAGAKSITVQTGKNFVVGQPVMIARTSAPGTTWMAGNVTSYDSGTGALVVNVVWTNGSGTFTDWTVSLAGPANPAAINKAGDAGIGSLTMSGDLSAPNVTVTGLLDFDETVVVIGANTSAVKSRSYVLTASLTLTLPASPAAGDWVKVVNRSGTATATVARNGQNIMGLAENMTLDDLNASPRLVFADATRGWVLA